MTNTKRISISERPIIFNGEMVRAILDDRKMMTRRIFWVTDPVGIRHTINSPKEEILQFDDGSFHYLSTAGLSGPYPCPYGKAGDILWVRENWAARLDEDHLSPKQLYENGKRSVGYWADGPEICCRTGCNGAAGKVRPSIHMPRWASRITLEITDVRVERVQDIADNDCESEGLKPLQGGIKSEFRILWDSINGKKEGCSWADNPYVWVVEFKRITP